MGFSLKDDQFTERQGGIWQGERHIFRVERSEERETSEEYRAKYTGKGQAPEAEWFMLLRPLDYNTKSGKPIPFSATLVHNKTSKMFLVKSGLEEALGTKFSDLDEVHLAITGRAFEGEGVTQKAGNIEIQYIKFIRLVPEEEAEKVLPSNTTMPASPEVVPDADDTREALLALVGTGATKDQLVMAAINNPALKNNYMLLGGIGKGTLLNELVDAGLLTKDGDVYRRVAVPA